MSDHPAEVPHDETRRHFEVGDRVREIQTGQTGTVAWDGAIEVGVLPDGHSLTQEYLIEELEHYDGPSFIPPSDEGDDEFEVVPALPVRPGLPGVGDALLSLAGILGAQLPDNPVVHAKLAELKTAVESAMPASTIEDGHGNGWKLCGPGCDLEVVRPGKVQCSGRVCGEATDPGPDPRNPDEIEERS